MPQLHIVLPCFLLLVLASTVSSGTPPLKKPQIRFISSPTDPYRGYYGHNGENVTLAHLNDTVYVIPKNLTQATIVCNASYPITWIFHNQHLLGHRSWMLNVRTRRVAIDLYDLSTYEYSAVLDLNGDYNRLTGKYTCQHITREEYGSSVFIFWQTVADPVFLHSKENLTVYYEKGMAILPCSVSEPDTRIYLQKITDNKAFQLLRFNRSISFDNTRGVILQDLPFAAGTYRCVRDREPVPPEGNEFVTVEVKIRNSTQLQDSGSTPKTNATLKYMKDPRTNQSTVVCCSNSTRAPRLIHNYCNHPITCAFRNTFVDADTKLNKWLYGNSRRHGTGCSKATLYVHSGGSVRCIGDGIDQTMQFIFGLRSFNYVDRNSYNKFRNSIPVYFQWAEINPHDMMLVESSSSRHYGGYYGRVLVESAANGPIFSGQTISVTCSASPYYFSEGLEWAVRWKNNTIQLRSSVSPFQSFEQFRYSNYYINLVLHVDMQSVMCIAPVWNTTEYVHKPLQLFVNQSILPILTGNLVESYTWTLNDTKKEIRCEASGVPLPDFQWAKLNDFMWNHQHINVNHSNVVNSTTNTTAYDSIQIQRVTFSTNGTYICTAINFAGKVQKTIHIYVAEPTSWKTGTAIVIGLFIVGSLLFGIGFMLWKLQKDRNVIRDLSNSMSYNTDNNGGIHHPGLAADDDNCTLDVPKLNSNLVH